MALWGAVRASGPFYGLGWSDTAPDDSDGSERPVAGDYVTTVNLFVPSELLPRVSSTGEVESECSKASTGDQGVITG